MRARALPAALAYGRRRLTRLEVAIYAAGCAAMIAIFLSTALDYMELAENAAMQTTLSVIVSNVNVKVAAEMLRGQAPLPGSLAGRNPFELAGGAPASFAGVLGSRELASIERPAWIFDSRRGEAIYLPKLHRKLRTADQSAALRFRLASQRTGLGYQLVSTSSYTWDVSK